MDKYYGDRKMNIKETRNIFFNEIENAHLQGKNIYILGAGSGAGILVNGLKKLGVFDFITGFVIDNCFDDGEIYKFGKPVMDTNKLSDETDKPLVILSIRGYNEIKKRKIENYANVIDEDIMSLWMLDGEELLTREYYDNNKAAFIETYNLLSDEKSRDCLEAYINSKISGKYVYLAKIWEENQYFAEDIIDIEGIASWIDCGAYDGDSYISFAKNYKDITGNDFSGKVTLYEPDKNNYERLTENMNKYKMVSSKCVNKGIWKKKDTLMFYTGDTTSSCFDDGGSVAIDVDCIDDLYRNEKVDFIKMDIEGSELMALQGGKTIIENNHPTLAVCVYHKREDLITIPQYIHKLNSDYKFYLRAYRRWSQELVLYAVER